MGTVNSGKFEKKRKEGALFFPKPGFACDLYAAQVEEAYFQET